MISKWHLILIIMLTQLACVRKTIIPSSIEIGNSTGMIITQLDSTLIPSRYTPISFLMDLNTDGEDDLNFYMDYSYSPRGGAHGNIKVKFLNNNIAFKGAKFDENVYIRLDTSYVNFKPPAIEKKVVRSYYFIPNGTKDSIVSINKYPFKTLALDKGNIIFTDDNFESGETSLHIDNQFTNDSSYKTYTSGDTTYTFFVNQKINENPFPWNKEIYFGFKLDDKSGSLLGWIKFNILDISSIKIIETAIQKS